MKKALKVIRLTRIKQYYLPVDAESYLTLRAVGIPTTRIHVDLLPTIQLLTTKENIRGIEVSFTHDILNPFLDKVGTEWLKGEHRTATIHAKTMRFDTTHQSVMSKAKKAVPELQACLERFFLRWGYRHTFEYSEHRGKCRLHVEYWFDAKTQPVIPLEKDQAEVPEVVLNFGFMQLKMKLMPREVHLTIMTSQGGKFTPFHSTRCLYSQVSDVLPFITALMEIPNIEPTNLENHGS